MKEKFFLHEPRVQLEQWDMTDFSPERLQTPGGYGFGQQTCHIDGSPPPPPPPPPLHSTSATPQAPAFVDFFNTLKLSIESVAWTSSFFVTLGL